MYFTKKIKLTSYITQAVVQLYSPFFGGKGTNIEKFNACLRPTLSVPEIIKAAVRFQESLRIIPMKARYRKRNRCGCTQ